MKSGSRRRRSPCALEFLPTADLDMTEANSRKPKQSSTGIIYSVKIVDRGNILEGHENNTLTTTDWNSTCYCQGASDSSESYSVKGN